MLGKVSRFSVPASAWDMVKRTSALAGQTKKKTDRDMAEVRRGLQRRIYGGETLEQILPEAFATVRECAARTVNMRHYDVQIVGGIVLHRGEVAEMQTGEGKTLVATLPAYLNSIAGRSVHIVTVNDYLAKRDAEWMGPVYKMLGLSVGYIVGGMGDEERRRAYGCDVVYATNKEAGFDYLRDRLKEYRHQADLSGDLLGKWEFESGRNATLLKCQREHHYAIVDEADSILIDEARVPLIISSSGGKESPYADAYRRAIQCAGGLREGRDFKVDVRGRRVHLARRGERAIAGLTPPASMLPPNRPWAHMIEQALIAWHIYRMDREYIISPQGEVVIVDEFTGRALPDRNWQLGLHQAVQAKEGLAVTEETHQTATTTYQRYFRLYGKLSGMTGTARPSWQELYQIYGLKVRAVPTNRPLRRTHLPARVFKTSAARGEAIIEEICELNAAGRPALVGTRSVDKSERISAALGERGVEHSVLNAKEHEKEAGIVALAGQKYQVTIATNMAGRGTDITLGANVPQLGGLHVVGTEYHEARRIDLQLGGRAGRQGDPGSFQFYGALDDELLRLWSPFCVRIVKSVCALLCWGDELWLSRPVALVFRLAQKSLERRHRKVRQQLMKRDEELDKIKGVLGVPAWG